MVCIMRIEIIVSVLKSCLIEHSFKITSEIIFIRSLYTDLCNLLILFLKLYTGIVSDKTISQVGP